MSDATLVDSRARWVYVAAAAMLVAMSFALLSVRPLFDPDEGRYAEISREMLASGEWIVPHLDGLAYVEKPPLQYWTSAAALRLFGIGELGARVYTALCAWATLSAVWLTARRLWGEAVAVTAVAVLAGMLLFVVMSQLVTLDMGLTCYMTWSLAAFLMAQEDVAQRRPAPTSSRRRWMLTAWLAMALGVLSKGLVAAAVPAAVLILYSAYSRDRSPWRGLYVRVGLPLFLLITVPWHWLAAAKLPGFLDFFFVHEHLSRYLTPSANRMEPWWFFAAVFVLGSLPWTPAALRVMATRWRRGARSQFDPVLFLWLWAAFICVFFSLSDSKLIPYILPALPAVALLIAACPAKTLERDVRLTAWLTVLVAAALAAAALYGPRFMPLSERNRYFALLARPFAEIAALLAVSAAFVLVRRRDLTQAAVVMGTGWCLAGLLFMRSSALVAPLYSGIVLARALPAVPAEVPIYSVETYDQTLPFYWRHTLTLVDYRGELDFGLTRDPAAGISILQFMERWRGEPMGYAVMETQRFDALQRAGLPMREMARDLHRVLVARR